jgi:hypothetical protein
MSEQQEAEEWRHKAVRRAIRISRLEGTIQAVTDLANEEIPQGTDWSVGYRAALADLREVLREFGHQPAGSGATGLVEAAANDRRWPLEKTGE